MAREDEIRQIAYCLWEQEGCCNGRDLEYWLRAEIVWIEKQKSAAQAEEPEKSAGIPDGKAGPDSRKRPAHKHR
jgi:hypothetical protein